MNLLYRLLLAALLVVLLPAASTSTAEAEKRLQVAINDVVAVADRSPSSSALAGSLRPVLEKYISFNAMTRRAIGPGWRQFTDDQQKKATQLFTTLAHPHLQQKADSRRVSGDQIQDRVNSRTWPRRDPYHPEL